MKTKNDSSVTRKVTHRLAVQKAIRKTARKNSIEEAITISLELVNAVNQASLTLAG